MGGTWSESYAIGIEKVDNQHKELFSTVDKLLSACGRGKGREEVGKVVDFLGEYVVKHFETEEKLQLKYGYPGYKAHKEIHDQFIKDFSGLKRQFTREGATLQFVVQLNRVVVDWLIKHVGETDKEMGRFLRERV